MVLAYIDTNVFLDFYQSSLDRMTVFDEILARAPNILLTQQTVDEFRRNRVARLMKLAENIKKQLLVQVFTTAVVQALPGFKEWTQAKDAANKAAHEIANELTSWALSEHGDLVLVAFEKLVSAAFIINADESVMTRAKTRKLLGQPPTSPDKHTIGDEINWECLLAWKNNDIVIVTRDKTYLDNQAILKREFAETTGHSLLLITDSLSDGLEKVGQASKEIEAAEKKLPSKRENLLLPTGSECPLCRGKLEEEGYDGPDGDSAWWLTCLKCGHHFYPPRDL